jgi:RecJ-like exonuclease
MSLPELKMFTQTFTPISFGVWQAENKEDLKKEFDALSFVDEQKDCEECYGDGTVSCDHGHDHECEECDGSGKIEQTYDEALYDYSVNQYHEQLKKDKEKLRVYYAERDNDRKS